MAGWLSPALAGASLAMLGRSFYVIYGLGRGTRAVRIITWVSAIFVVAFWAWRLATSQSVFWG